MQLNRTETLRDATREYEQFVELISRLDDSEWRKASRCEGFEVRDIVYHVVGVAEDIAHGAANSRSADEHAAAMRGVGQAEAVARLRTCIEQVSAMVPAFDNDEVWNGPSGVPGFTLAQGVVALWGDLYIHADDIRSAVGHQPVRGPGLRAALAWIETELIERGWGPATINFTGQDDGFGSLAVHSGSTTANAEFHEVDPYEFMLAATGRSDTTRLGLDASVNIFAEGCAASDE